MLATYAGTPPIPGLEDLQDVRPAAHHQNAPRRETNARRVFAMILQSSFSDHDPT